MSNCKNSLKSGGSRIVAIEDLSHLFEGFQALLGRLLGPVGLLVALRIERADGKGAAVQLRERTWLTHRRELTGDLDLTDDPARCPQTSCSRQPGERGQLELLRLHQIEEMDFPRLITSHDQFSVRGGSDG